MTAQRHEVITADESRAVVEHEPREESGQLAVFMRLIERAASDPNFDDAKLQRLMEMRDKWEANEARKAYHRAMAQFKRNAPKLVKDAHVAFTNNRNQLVEYDHASLGAICEAVIEGLAGVGISHNWEPEEDDKNKYVSITCVLTHEDGHSTRTRLSGHWDESGSKNPLQAKSSAVSYLQRYTVLAATGLAPKGTNPMYGGDDDGRGAAPPIGTTPAELKKISEKQLADLEAKISEVGANRENFLKFLRVTVLGDLLECRYKAAIQALEERAREKSR